MWDRTLDHCLEFHEVDDQLMIQPTFQKPLSELAVNRDSIADQSVIVFFKFYLRALRVLRGKKHCMRTKSFT